MSDDEHMTGSDEGEDFSDPGTDVPDDFMTVSRQVSQRPDDGECLKPSQLIEAQLRAIEEVNTIFQISTGTARILLEHFHWDKERLLERYYDGDQAKLFAEARVVCPEGGQQRATKTSSSRLVTCAICYTDYPASEMTGLDCGHVFCEDCWNGHLEAKINIEGTKFISCPAEKCLILVDELTVTRILRDKATLAKYQYLVAKSFVSGNRHVKWCPKPGCENAVRLGVVEAKPVNCQCGHSFCFGCLEPAHLPLKCEMLLAWLKKCNDDSETSNWIAAHTKLCPKCKSVIEKNGGCNHMTCRNSGCRYEFCWICLGEWSPHGSSWFNCGRFDDQSAVDARDAQKKQRESLERYLFYYNRYANHAQSRKLEQKLESLVARKEVELQAAGMSWMEVQFLRTAVNVLSECRNTLCLTYAFAYYLTPNNQSAIFEDNQKDLEMATETLSGYLEGDASLCEDTTQLRRSVLDRTKYCEQRRKTLVEHVEEGYAKNWWSYNTRFSTVPGS